MTPPTNDLECKQDQFISNEEYFRRGLDKIPKKKSKRTFDKFFLVLIIGGAFLIIFAQISAYYIHTSLSAWIIGTTLSIFIGAIFISMGLFCGLSRK